MVNECIVAVPPLKNAIPHARTRITTVLIAVARSVSTPRIPTFANIAVKAAKSADSKAKIHHIIDYFKAIIKTVHFMNANVFFKYKYFWNYYNREMEWIFKVNSFFLKIEANYYESFFWLKGFTFNPGLNKMYNRKFWFHEIKCLIKWKKWKLV